MDLSANTPRERVREEAWWQGGCEEELVEGRKK